ncbi:hypothetical protein ACRAWG_08200 [Methylobacterium sp. P31]
MIVLVFAALIGGVISLLGAWPWLGLYSALIAPFGAGSAAVAAGLILACRRGETASPRSQPVTGPQAADHHIGLHEDVRDQRQRA